MKKLVSSLLILSIIIAANTCSAAPEIKITPEWKDKIRELAPSKPRVTPQIKHKVLVFSLMTGFQHWVTPHTAEILNIMADKSGAFEIVQSNDIEMFAPDKINQFHAIILNNNCSKGPGRNMFIDVLGDNKTRAAELEDSLIKFVADGNGLVAIHGAITILNSSEKFGKVLGGAFDFHPKQQEVTANLVDPNHPLVKALEGKPLIHEDEPYLFNGAYQEKNFRPLLVMDTSKLDCGKQQEKVQSDIRYVAWIKKYEKGRVFYCSPSHNAQSFEDPRLLQFLLDGIQYALGDIECDDSPMQK